MHTPGRDILNSLLLQWRLNANYSQVMVVRCQIKQRLMFQRLKKGSKAWLLSGFLALALLRMAFIHSLPPNSRPPHHIVGRGQCVRPMRWDAAQ